MKTKISMRYVFLIDLIWIILISTIVLLTPTLLYEDTIGWVLIIFICVFLIPWCFVES